MRKAPTQIIACLTAFAAVTALTLSFAARSFADGTQDFTLHNKTGYTIHKLWISPTTTNEWEENVLGQDALEDGASVKITFSPKEKAEKWDLKVQWDKGDDAEWHDLKLNEITDVTLHWSEADGSTAVIEP